MEELTNDQKLLILEKIKRERIDWVHSRSLREFIAEYDEYKSLIDEFGKNLTETINNIILDSNELLRLIYREECRFSLIYPHNSYFMSHMCWPSEYPTVNKELRRYITSNIISIEHLIKPDVYKKVSKLSYSHEVDIIKFISTNIVNIDTKPIRDLLQEAESTLRPMLSYYSEVGNKLSRCSNLGQAYDVFGDKVIDWYAKGYPNTVENWLKDMSVEDRLKMIDMYFI